MLVWRSFDRICLSYIAAEELDAMNAPDINRSILRMHIASIEAKYPIKTRRTAAARQRRARL